MRLSYRLNTALIAGVVATSLGFAIYQGVTERRGLRHAAARDAAVLAQSLQGTLEPLVSNHADEELQGFVERLQGNDGLLGIAVFDQAGQQLAVTSGLARRMPVLPAQLRQAIADGIGRSQFEKIGNTRFHILVAPLRSGTEAIGSLAVVHDVTYIDVQSARIWRDALIRMAAEALCIVCITLLILHLSLRQPLARMAQWLRDIHAGRPSAVPDLPHEAALEPIAREVERMASSLYSARAAAAEEARLRNDGESLWTVERLRAHVRTRLDGSKLFVISNREPYEHSRNGSLKWRVPPSGLVTALEPVLSACGGTWIAQATGDADGDVVDEFGRVAVPPDDPKYSLRRLWLTPPQEQGFYLGFSNEGLWPLCHIAHTQPIFRSEDWEQYKEVNRIFADALVEEAAGEPNPIVLVQDYHFALLPRMIKQRLPGAHVAIFWHIPWPNSEAFGICPYRQELLDGILGADLVGFQIQLHCNSFLDTVDRFLESRIEREHFGVNRLGHFTSVRPFPISVKPMPAALPSDDGQVTGQSLLRKLGIEAQYLGVGVDRIDYTKGIPERFRGVERFFEMYPQYRGKFTFVQIGAPSRGHVRRYQELAGEVEKDAERINRRFRKGKWQPIVLIKRQHSHAEILPYYRAASFCLVTSLHDGMNLVAKEFVSSRDDEAGALILSRFTGASHELTDALTVNPYDADQIARAIRDALEMPPDEARSRMRRMRTIVRERNIYRWAGDLIGELADIRVADAPVELVPVIAEVDRSATCETFSTVGRS